MIHVSPAHKMLGVPASPAVQAQFPAARVVPFQGAPTVLLPHSLLETKLLRGLGFDVPAPVLTQYDWPHPFGQPPFDVQRKTVALMTTNQRAYNLNGMGCVDADTEYLSPTGWARIADYKTGMVAQYDPGTRSIEFVQPKEYVRLPCPEMIRFKTARGVDQLLSEEHRVLLSDGSVMRADEIEKLYGTRASREFKFRTVFNVVGTSGLPLTDAQIRVMVAVNADGHERSKGRVDIRLKRPRKIVRLRQLLIASGLVWAERDCLPTGFRRFNIQTPWDKGFGPAWWEATQEQLCVIADEAVHWDGSLRKAGGFSFCSRAKADADFVQYAYSASGRRASLSKTCRDNGVDFTVHASAGNSDVGLYGASKGVVRKNVWREASPDGFKYCFTVPTTFLLLRRNGCVFATGNTGKTRCALWSFDYLQKAGLAKKMLVVGPLSTLNFTWKREVFSLFPHMSATVLHGTKAQRLKRLAEDHDIYIINPDGLTVLADELMARTDIDALCIDELAVFRNHKSNKTVYAEKLAKRMMWMWGMTGSPTPEEPTDAYGQCRIVTPASVPTRFSYFRDATMTRVSQFRYVAKNDSKDTVFRAMQPAVRFTLDDVIELPEVVERTVDIGLGKRQHEVYEALRKDAYAMVDKAEIVPANAGVVLGKMLQVSMGYLYHKDDGADERTIIPLDNDLRLDQLVDDINACGNKLIVFSPYTHALTGISARLKKEGIDHAVIDGSTASKQRDEYFNLFQNTDKYKTLVAHPGTMSHGVTLHRADTIIWFGPTASLETYSQACARIRRVGQKKKQLILHYQSTAAEKMVYTKLRAKEKVQDGLLALFEDHKL